MTALSPEERRIAILQMLERDASVQVTQIAEAFGISRGTARTDLDALARDGKLRRTHGGATSLSRTLNLNVDAKRRIARRAASLVEEGDSILVDSGTTSLEFVRALSGLAGITVVTDDFTIADFVDRSMPATDVIMLGGVLRKGHRYTDGPLALASLARLHPDKAFVTPTAYAPGRGLLTNNQAMAELKRAVLSCAEKTYILMDASKVGARGLMWFGTLAECDAVVMDADPEGRVAAELEEMSTELLL